MSSSISRTDISLQQRKVEFDFSESALHWNPQDPFVSHFVSVLHTMLPAGEFYFCRLYNKALPLITDEKLKQDLQGFIRQEASHARAHTHGINNYLKKNNLEVDSFIEKIDWVFEVALDDKPFGITLPKTMERRWLITRLGIIAALEHYTCVLGKYALENTQWDQDQADPVILDILRWHGAEEVEHRNVAFDVYRHLGGNYWPRYPQMLLVMVAMMGLWCDGTAHLMRQDNHFANPHTKLYGRTFWRLWLNASNNKRMPSPAWLVKQALRYLSPNYNPMDEADTAMATRYLAQSPAARAAAAIH